MQITVLYFGLLRELVGTEQQVLEIATASTVGDVLDLCRARTSKQSEIWTRVAAAVNREYGTRQTVLAAGDEVALLPPVSGGGRCR